MFFILSYERLVFFSFLFEHFSGFIKSQTTQGKDRMRQTERDGKQPKKKRDSINEMKSASKVRKQKQTAAN